MSEIKFEQTNRTMFHAATSTEESEANKINDKLVLWSQERCSTSS